MIDREMIVPDATGHTKHMWDSSNETEVTAARTLYDTLTSQGYRAFNVKKDGEAGTRMDTFDPDAEKVIFAPHLRGG